jgi:hypothetical protein
VGSSDTGVAASTGRLHANANPVGETFAAPFKGGASTAAVGRRVRVPLGGGRWAKRKARVSNLVLVAALRSRLRRELARAVRASACSFLDDSRMAATADGPSVLTPLGLPRN